MGRDAEPVARLVYRISQASRRLGVGETVLRHMIDSGELKAVRLRGRLAITDAELRAFIERLPEARREAPVAPPYGAGLPGSGSAGLPEAH